MKIVIAGTGEITAYLAEALSNESQDVIVVSEDQKGLSAIDKLCNVMTVSGNPTTLECLSSLRLEDCKMFIALMPHDADNLLACSMAKHLGAGNTMAHASTISYISEANLKFFKEKGIDHVINYQYLAAKVILSSLRHPWSRAWEELYGGNLIIAGLRVTSETPAAGKTLREFEYGSRNFHIAVIKRGDSTIIPHGEDTIEEGDTLYFTLTKDGVDSMTALNGIPRESVKKVLIMGGSEIGIHLSNLEGAGKFSFKIIEKDHDKANLLLPLVRNCQIINGDGAKTETLEYAGSADSYVALSKSDEVNLLACVTARESGIRHVLAILDDHQNIMLAEHFGIDNVINLKMLAANYVFQQLLNSSVPASKVVALTDAEIVSLTAMPGSRITKGAVKDLKLPKEITLAGMVHEGRGRIVDGNSVIMPGDNVVVACRSGAIPKVERLFS